MSKKNPYLASYIWLAFICCLALTILHFYISYVNMLRIKEDNDKKRIEMIIEDWSNQLQIFEDIALQISINKIYQPYFYRESVINEMQMLEDFESYQHYSTLTQEHILYQGTGKIYLSSGRSAESLQLHLKLLSEEGREQIMDTVSKMGIERKILVADGDIYVFHPIRVYEKTQRKGSVLISVVESKALQERFGVVSGGIEGNLSLYWMEDLVYCNQETACSSGQKGTLEVTTSDGETTICYASEKQFDFWGVLPLQIFLVLTDLVLVLTVARLFAHKSYESIIEIADGYRKKIPRSDDAQCKNALEEIDYMLNELIQNNEKANGQIREKQEMLRRQLLQMLLTGKYSFDINYYLDKINIRVGNYLFVISIAFAKEDDITKEFLNRVKTDLENIYTDDAMKAVYAVCDYNKRQISVICTMEEPFQKEEITELVCEVAESYECEPKFGIGNVYQEISCIEASWLESIDNIHKNSLLQAKENSFSYIYDSNDKYRIFSELSRGNEEAAVEGLHRYLEQIENDQMSMLMQQYLFANFLSEITKIAYENQIELQDHNICLAISARNVDNFNLAATNLIHEFCEKRRELEAQAKTNEKIRIHEYVMEHYAEYDQSIEKTAADLNTTVLEVRKAIFEYTGKKYKDYIIFLRIEYAKKLLVKENITIAEVCQRTGYGNLSHFIKLFKEMTGVTPAKYRSKGD